MAVFERFLEENRGWVENNIDACCHCSYCHKELGHDQAALAALFRTFTYDRPRAEVCCDIGLWLSSPCTPMWSISSATAAWATSKEPKCSTSWPPSINLIPLRSSTTELSFKPCQHRLRNLGMHIVNWSVFLDCFYYMHSFCLLNAAYDLGVTAMFGINRAAKAFETCILDTPKNYQHTLEDILRLLRAVKQPCPEPPRFPASALRLKRRYSPRPYRLPHLLREYLRQSAPPFSKGGWDAVCSHWKRSGADLEH